MYFVSKSEENRKYFLAKKDHSHDDIKYPAFYVTKKPIKPNATETSIKPTHLPPIILVKVTHRLLFVQDLFD